MDADIQSAPDVGATSVVNAKPEGEMDALLLGRTGRQKPRQIRLHRMPKIADSSRYNTKALWLNHNRLPSTLNLETGVNNLLDQPQCLTWLDLSFNRIKELDDSITKFPCLKILYLHGNLMTDLIQVAKLRYLDGLKSLTLHGNPFETTPSYRLHVLNMLPQIITLDFSHVCYSERQMAPPAGTVFKFSATEVVPKKPLA